MSTRFSHFSQVRDAPQSFKLSQLSLIVSVSDLMNAHSERTEKCPIGLWRIPTGEIKLAHGEVHVWRADLDLAAEALGKLNRTLSKDERDRAERFRFPRDRDRFIAGRGLLREILGHYLDEKPTALKFDYGSYGKPGLRGQGSPNGIFFNISHSEGLGLYAVGRGREIGVDVEKIRKDISIYEIAKHHFSSNEFTVLKSLSQNDQAEAFFNCWTRKEAYIKALGTGLSLSLDKFDVSLAPGEPATLLRVAGQPGELSRWSFRDLRPETDYVAGLVVEGQDWCLKCWGWTNQEL